MASTRDIEDVSLRSASTSPGLEFAATALRLNVL
jgi:hypothetical protein